MSHEIEAEFVDDFENIDRQCWNCTSFQVHEGGECFCTESKTQVSPTGHCNYFQAVD
ncbi:MAG: hypothetical protein ACOYL8_02950 [Patescibacteria group bacterium]